jgi:hypothetical protein
MQLGCSLPVADIGHRSRSTATMRRQQKGSATLTWWRPTMCSGPIGAPITAAAVGTTANAYHDPFVRFGLLNRLYPTDRFDVGVFILVQWQVVLVATQAASLDHLPGGRFQLGIGVG